MSTISTYVARDDERLLVRIAWACEIEGLTQAEAAERFGLTRLRVNKALAEARSRGIVRVYIDSDYAPCAQAEYDIKTKYSLNDAHVAPVFEQQSDVRDLIGSYLGQYLSNLLADTHVQTFGVAWGSTLNSAMQYLRPMNRPDLEVMSVMGCVSRASDVNIIESARILANLCNAQKRYFTAPLYADSSKSRNLLIKQTVFHDMLERIRAVDAMTMTVGDASSLSSMIRDGLPRSVTVNELVKAGAVGDVLGYYLDENGRRIKHDINGCVVGMELEDLQRIPNLILAAGGQHKVKIIHALLKRQVVNTLVTDQLTANALIRHD
ncbi:MAG: sugar-binding transcriptional regulator [Granulosicoccus sp.]